MSDMSGFGLPKSRPIAPKRRKPLTPYAAQRLRFGVLAARHMLERDRLTGWQHDDLEGCIAAGWKYRDSQRAFNIEHAAIWDRARFRGGAISLDEMRRLQRERINRRR